MGETLGAESRELQDHDLVKEEYQTTLWIKKGEYNGSLHDAIGEALRTTDDSTITEIFGVENPNRVLTEGYKIEDELVVEDIAITGSQYHGEIALAQVVSSNGKRTIGDIPKDFIQARTFGDRLERFSYVKPNPTGVYVIRTDIGPEELLNKKIDIEEDLEENGETSVRLDIYEVEPLDVELNFNF